MKIRRSLSLVEKSQLENPKRYQIIKTKSSKVFDELVAYSASLFNVQIAVINFADPQNVWDKNGEPIKKILRPRLDTSVCSLAIANENVIAFQKLSVAPYLISNALIAAELGMGFYAAVPIINESGTCLGTVCILDQQRREFLSQDREKLEWVAGIVQKEMIKKIAPKQFV